MRDRPLYVSKPVRPDKETLHRYLDQIEDSGVYTNFGPLERELTDKIASRFGTNKVVLSCNGSVALLIALLSIRSSRKKIITTPFTFAATVQCISLAGYEVVFCDIDPQTFNLCPKKLEEICDDQVAAVLGVHVYGNPCDHQEISRICRKYDAVEMYDAAHCFDAYEGGRSLYTFGDVSVASFHATKLLHAGEGGAIFCADPHRNTLIKSMINFCIQGEDTIDGVGLNGKMSEINAAVALSVLNSINKEVEIRKSVHQEYHNAFSKFDGLGYPLFRDNVTRNYLYYPVLIEEKMAGFNRDDLWSALRRHDIYARKYFFPLLSNCRPYSQITATYDLEHAERVSQNVICLPLHSGVRPEDINQIAQVIEDLHTAGASK